MTIEITPTELVAFTPSEVAELNFTELNPFDDNGAETDGPSYLLELAPFNEGAYNVEVPETLAPRNDFDGYRMENIQFPISNKLAEILKQAGVTRWMYNNSQQFALFVATLKQAEQVEDACKDIEVYF